MKSLCGRLVDCRMEGKFAVAFRIEHGLSRRRVTIYRFCSTAADRIQKFFDEGGRRIAFIGESLNDYSDSINVTSVDFGDKGGEVSLGGDLEEA